MIDNNDINKKNESDEIISVLFVTQGNQDSSDLFSSLEERLYQDFPKYRNIEKVFMVHANNISSDKTLKENQIKNNDIISLFPID